MTELERILPLWRALEKSGSDCVLATVIAVKGSSYRKPGARMLLASDGRRAGTVSGGCLEAEVARRAWWLTESGFAVEDYSTAMEPDGEHPFGSGCGGVVTVLLERRSTASPWLAALEDAFLQRLPLAAATVLDGPMRGKRAFSGTSSRDEGRRAAWMDELAYLADRASRNRSAFHATIRRDGAVYPVWVDYCPARPGLWVFGAGDDAHPILQIARTMGWFVSIADGRSHLATRNRFPVCEELRVLDSDASPQATRAALDLRPTDAALIMTHSFKQDAHLLAALFSENGTHPLAYLGVLGSERRTRQLLMEAARLLDLPGAESKSDAWIEQIHTPMGLDLGNNTPAEIALAVIAEIQQTISGTTALSLSELKTGKTPRDAEKIAS